MKNTRRLEDMPKKQRQFSAIDRIPEEIRQQLIDAKTKRTHTILEMLEWLHNEDFENAYDHITAPMLNNWFMRRGHRANT